MKIIPPLPKVLSDDEEIIYESIKKWCTVYGRYIIWDDDRDMNTIKKLELRKLIKFSKKDITNSFSEVIIIK